MKTDADWVKHAFMLPKNAMSLAEAKTRLLSDATFKFTDTTLGGNFAINPPPQFTRYADVKVRGRSSASNGMGRYYSEAIDDGAVLVHMRFGVPEHNSLHRFYGSAYNHAAATMARTGRSPTWFYQVGKAVGFVTALPFKPFIWIGDIYRWAMRKPASRYYYLKPAMPLYWNAVNTIANGIAVNMGIVPRVLGGDAQEFKAEMENYTEDQIKNYHRMLPDIFRPDGGIDIYAVATRAQRLADRNRRNVEAQMESVGSMDDLRRKLREYSKEEGRDALPASRGIASYLESYQSSIMGSVAEDAPNELAESTDNWSMAEKMRDFFVAEQRDGAAWVTFRVDNPGSTSASFSNNVRESDISSTLNGMSSSAKSTRFSIGDGKVLDDGLVGSILGYIGKSANDMVNGTLEQWGLSGLSALAGNAMLDIPKHWDGSTANLPRSDFTMELRSPYGNKMSRYMRLMVPLSMILGGVLPLSAGKQSYTSPFLCEIYVQGRQQVRLGMIDSLTVTLGAGNMGYTQHGEPLGIDIQFSVVDMSSVLHMPITAGFSITDPLKGMIDDDNAYTDFLAVLGSMSLADQVYVGRRLKLAMTRKMTEFKSWASPSHFVNFVNGTWPAQVLAMLARESDRSNQ